MEIRLERLDYNNYRLAWNFRVNPSSCENPEYFSSYLLFSALSDWRTGLGTTHLLIEQSEDEEKILGYITLRASSYTKENMGSVLGEPAMEIFELAVAEGEERQGVGETLVKYAIADAMSLREESLGIKYVLLCATEQAVTFYEHMGFGRIGQYGEVPRDLTNQNCIPMILKLPEEEIKSGE